MNAWLTSRQRPGLVERDHADIRKPFEVSPSLDQHAVSRRRGQRCHDRDRSGDHERARTSDDQKHQRAIEPGRGITSGEERRHNCNDGRECNHCRRVDAGESIDKRLNRRALRLGSLDEVDDASEPRVPSNSDHLEIERSTAVDRAGIHLVAGSFVDGERLSRDRCLVDIAVSGQDPAVERNLVAWTAR